MLDKNITALRGIGDKRAQLFNKLGVFDVNDLLYFYPRDYTDLSEPCSPIHAPFDTPCAVKATVISPVKEAMIRRGMTLFKFKAAADGVTINITLFNNKFLAKKIQTNQEYIFYGVMNGNLLTRSMSSPEIIPVHKAYIRPTYRATAGLASYIIEAAAREAVQYANQVKDPIPPSIREKYKLMPLSTALRCIHFPESMSQLKTARRRLMFQEMLVLQCGLIYMGNDNHALESVVISNNYINEFEQLLKFTLTDAQKRAINQAAADMQSGKQMNRLLQGDVGSGKTAVAACLSYNCCKSGYQAAIMAPTEILAEQHFKSFTQLFDQTDIRCALLTGSVKGKQRSELLDGLKNGKIDVLIGTHAIIENSVEFKNLALVITDEQHRFGVRQRSRLALKSNAPHTLVMSATPIPRTLALIIYGDLDISVLDSLPAGRKPIQTRLIKTDLRPTAYDFVRRQLDKGRQAYIVCPLIESGEDNQSDMVSVLEYYEKLKNSEFKNYRIGLLHGKMKPAEKERVMSEFSAGNLELIVSTTVIEVGVDVPNAVIMMIENADRFGLSQLHQLRGRVGRGSYKSYCILVSDADNEATLERLNIMCRTTDGFEISEYDLKTRGPGDFFGNRQHGLPELKLCNLLTDYQALTFSQNIAKEIMTNDARLEAPENAELKNFILRMFDEVKGGLN